MGEDNKGLLDGVRVELEGPGHVAVRRETRESLAEVHVDDGARQIWFMMIRYSGFRSSTVSVDDARAPPPWLRNCQGLQARTMASDSFEAGGASRTCVAGL